MDIKRLAKNSICLTILIVSAEISFLVSEIAFTLQLLVVLLLAFILPPKDATLINIIYIIMGLIGLPVFANFTGGIMSVVKPSFGYLLGFIFVPLINYLVMKIKIKNELVKHLMSGIISCIIIYIIGSIYFYLIRKFYFINEISIKQVILICVVPFIIIDSIKVITASLIAIRIKKENKKEYEHH